MRFKWSKPCLWRMRGVSTICYVLQVHMVRQLILPLQSCHKFKKDDISAAKILHSVACGISFLSSHCPDWPLLKSRHVLYNYLKKSWLVWRDNSQMSLTQVIWSPFSAIIRGDNRICCDVMARLAWYLERRIPCYSLTWYPSLFSHFT